MHTGCGVLRRPAELRDEDGEERSWWVEGAAGRPAYLNRIDDPLNAEPARTTCQHAMKGRGLIDSAGLGGEKMSTACSSRAVTTVAGMDRPTPLGLSLGLTQKCH